MTTTPTLPISKAPQTSSPPHEPSLSSSSSMLPLASTFKQRSVACSNVDDQAIQKPPTGNAQQSATEVFPQMLVELIPPLASILFNVEATIGWLDRPNPNVTEALTGLRELATLATDVHDMSSAMIGVHSERNLSNRELLLDSFIQEAIATNAPEMMRLEIAIHCDVQDRCSTYADEARLSFLLRSLFREWIDLLRHQPRETRQLNIATCRMTDRTILVVENYNPLPSNTTLGAGTSTRTQSRRLEVCAAISRSLGGSMQCAWSGGQIRQTTVDLPANLSALAASRNGR